MAKLPTLIATKSGIVRRLDRAALDRAREEDAERETSDRYRARHKIVRGSSVGQCERKLWAVLHSVEPDEEIPGRVHRIFQLGNVIEDIVVADLERAGYEIDGQQAEVSVSAGNGSIIGHIDGIVFVEGEKLLLEIKSSNANRFEQVKGVGYEAWDEKYAAQVQLYMGALGLKGALAVVYCKDTSAYYVERVPFRQKVFDSLVKKVERVTSDEFEKFAIPRPRPARGKGSAYCKWCSHGEWCYGPFVEEVPT